MTFNLTFALKRFQFQTGAIKSTILNQVEAGVLSFNSKLVRLKASLPSTGWWIVTCFNSKLVRLKVRSAGEPLQTL